MKPFVLLDLTSIITEHLARQHECLQIYVWAAHECLQIYVWAAGWVVIDSLMDRYFVFSWTGWFQFATASLFFAGGLRGLYWTSQI